MKRINKKYAQPNNKFTPTQKFVKGSEDETFLLWDNDRLNHNQVEMTGLLQDVIVRQPPQRALPDFNELDEEANTKGKLNLKMKIDFP